MATNASLFSPMGSPSQYPQQPQQSQQQPSAENYGPLPAYLQQTQNTASANPSPTELPGMTGMPGMSQESKLGGEQPQQQVALPPQTNSDSFSFNKKEATPPQSPAFGGKKDKKDTKFAEGDTKEKPEFSGKSPFAKSVSFGEDEKKEKE